jgi:hypothetical protein
MANIIDYYLYVKGPGAIVDQIATGPFPRCYDKQTLSVTVLRDSDGTKTTKIKNDCPSDPPFPWLEELAVKYQNQGVTLYLCWFDADNWDYQSRPVVNYRFGEMYTAPLSTFVDAAVRQEYGLHTENIFSAEAGAWYYNGPLTIVFSRSQRLGDKVTEVWLDHHAVNIDDVQFIDDDDEPGEHDADQVIAVLRAKRAARQMTQNKR